MSMRQNVSSRNFGSSNPNIAYFITHETKRRKTLRFAFYGVFVSDVCLHLWSQNRYQNANMDVLCACLWQVLKHDSKTDKISCELPTDERRVSFKFQRTRLSFLLTRRLTKGLILRLHCIPMFHRNRELGNIVWISFKENFVMWESLAYGKEDIMF